jgi:competence protein ComGC
MLASSSHKKIFTFIFITLAVLILVGVTAIAIKRHKNKIQQEAASQEALEAAAVAENLNKNRRPSVLTEEEREGASIFMQENSSVLTPEDEAAIKAIIQQ